MPEYPLMATASDTDPGLFGKMPMLGDFISRRLSAAFVDPWDEWLRQGIAHSRETLGSDWLPLYLAGPLWRFALHPRVLSKDTKETVAGVMMPSVDAVNRHFPLTVVAVAPSDCGPFTLAAEAEPWFAAAERFALSSLEPDATVASVERGLDSLGPISVCGSPGGGGCDPSWTSGQRWRLASDLPESLIKVCPRLLDAAAIAAYGLFSLWWTAGSDEVEPVLLLFSGLPAADAFPFLFRDARPELPAISGTSP
ncbi:MAG: type VI secretion system-associated protein TagF [Rhodospirillales bacterium]